jgi:hypothetical protein
MWEVTLIDEYSSKVALKTNELLAMTFKYNDRNNKAFLATK